MVCGSGEVRRDEGLYKCGCGRVYGDCVESSSRGRSLGLSLQPEPGRGIESEVAAGLYLSASARHVVYIHPAPRSNLTSPRNLPPPPSNHTHPFSPPPSRAARLPILHPRRPLHPSHVLPSTRLPSSPSSLQLIARRFSSLRPRSHGPDPVPIKGNFPRLLSTGLAPRHTFRRPDAHDR